MNTRNEHAILRKLKAVEDQYGVRVLYAVESGSRAWGFESPNSDYDVRFVYVHEPSWYVSVEEKRDVIELALDENDLDCVGWELRKALRLFKKTNPSLMEWLYSPIVYRCDGQFAPTLRALVKQHYSSVKGMYRYISMARTNYRGYLLKDIVPLKKYFYVLRPLLAARWIEYFESVPPVLFDRLLALLEDEPDVLEAVNQLLALKSASGEKQMIERVEVLNNFIERNLNAFEKYEVNTKPSVLNRDLDLLLRAWVA